MYLNKDKFDREGNERFLTESHVLFWQQRRKIIKRYKYIDKSKAETVFSSILGSVNESQNKALKALKVLQLQKQVLRIELVEISVPRGKKRGKRGGRRAQRKELYDNNIKEKAVTKTTVSVLKLLMFEDTRPDLIPDYLKKKDDTNDNKRDGCCLII
jgi:hypothetical protein